MRAFKLIAAVCMALLLAVQTAFPAYAAGSDIEWMFGIFSEGKTDLYDGLEFGDNDWAALCRIRLYGAEGAENYLRSVKSEAEQLMSSDGFVKPTELQRAAIVLSAADACSEELINAAVWNNDKLERQGINAYIWALIAANCYGGEAPENALNTTGSLTEYLLSRQLADGGFSLKGTAADTDITAAVIYALAPLSEDGEVSDALDKAERCLRSVQLESGGYSSMGIENCESAAQAVIAFAALGHGTEDEQVAAALSAMMEYRTDSGFSHLADGDTNGTATVQALLALTSMELISCGEYLYCAVQTDDITEHETAHEVTQEQTVYPESTAEADKNTAMSGSTLKLVIGGSLVAVGAIVAVVLLICRKKALLIIPVLLCVSGIVVMLLDISTPEEYYSSVAGGDMSVTVSVDCTAALRYDLDGLPESGMLMEECTVSLPDGATAFDALIEAAKVQQLRVDYNGSVFGEYVSGIGTLNEFDCGSESGWLYEVNGEHPSVSAGAYALKDGDKVKFLYTCTLGQYPPDKDIT